MGPPPPTGSRSEDVGEEVQEGLSASRIDDRHGKGGRDADMQSAGDVLYFNYLCFHSHYHSHDPDIIAAIMLSSVPDQCSPATEGIYNAVPVILARAARDAMMTVIAAVVMKSLNANAHSQVPPLSNVLISLQHYVAINYYRYLIINIVLNL